MAMHEFDLSQIEKIRGGRVLALWRQLVQQLLFDLEDRPYDSGKRSISLTLELVPVVEGESLDRVKATWRVPGVKMPAFLTGETDCSMRTVTKDGARQRMLIFNDMSEDDVRQRTFDEGDHQA